MKISSNHLHREENSVNNCNAELFQKLFVCHKKIAYCLVELRDLQQQTYMFKIHSFIRCSTRLLHLRPGYEKGKKYLKESRRRVGGKPDKFDRYLWLSMPQHVFLVKLTSS